MSSLEPSEDILRQQLATLYPDARELERAAKLKPHLPRKLKKQLKHKGWDWKRYWFLSRTQDEQLGYGVAHGSQVQELAEAADARCLEHMLAAAANHNSSGAGESACTP